jgi:hypothetical protein
MKGDIKSTKSIIWHVICCGGEKKEEEGLFLSSIKIVVITDGFDCRCPTFALGRIRTEFSGG